MKRIAFAADMFGVDPDFVPPSIHHDDPQVMTMARILLNASGDYGDHKPSGWEYQMDGATQDSAYYAEPYRRTIAEYIEMAERVLAAIREEGWIT